MSRSLNMKKIPAVNVYEFRQTDESETINMPEIALKRKSTDITFLLVFLEAVFLTLVIATCTGIINTDYNRFLNGYDKCGDTCGSNNVPIVGINCSGKDLRDKTIIQMELVRKESENQNTLKTHLIPEECVNTCDPPKQLFFQRCLPADVNVTDGSQFFEELKQSWIILILPMVLTGFVLSVLFYYAFSWSSKITIIIILSLSLVTVISFAACIWYIFSLSLNDRTLMIFCITISIGIFFMTISLCMLHDRYSLAIQMYAEVSEATVHLPGLILIALFNLIYLCVSIIGTVFLICLVSTSGNLKKNPDFDFYEYTPNSLSQFSVVYLLLTLIWNIAFTDSCQCIVVAGAISSHYFQRDKSQLSCPVFKSFYILIRFHLGTAAFGSLCTTFLYIIRIVFKFFDEKIKCKSVLKCMDYALVFLEEIIEYLTKRSYIETALHGTPLYKSGVRAARLMWANLLDSLALHVVGDFIMLCTIVLTVLTSFGVATVVYYSLDMNLKNVWSILAIGSSASGFIIYFYIQIINVALETIFICFCEDKLLNDGTSTPYFMSERLKTLIDRAKQQARKREDN